MRRPALLLLLAAAAAAQDADDYFEVGVTYLKKGFFGPARRAFGESLARAPGEPVTLAFLGLAGAGEGRPASEPARAFRTAYTNLPEGKALKLDLDSLLPSRKALRLLLDDYVRRAGRARGAELRDALTVAAFLEAHGGLPTPSLDRLEREFEGDEYAGRLRDYEQVPAGVARAFDPKALRAGAGPCSSPTTPPSPSAPSSAPAGWHSSRTRS